MKTISEQHTERDNDNDNEENDMDQVNIHGVNDDEEEGEEEEEGESLQSVECVDFAPVEYKWMASGGLDKTLKIWDFVSGTCRTVCSHPASVVSLKWHAQLPFVTTAALDNNIRIFDARAGN